MSKHIPLYYECHITIEPVFEDRLIQLQEVASTHSFKVANLILRKSHSDPGIPAQDDTFCSAKSDNLETLRAQMLLMLENLMAFGYKILRYKIESIVIDSKKEDCYGFLNLMI